MTHSHSQKNLYALPQVAEIQECARQLIDVLQADRGLSDLQIAAMIGGGDKKTDAGVVMRLKAKMVIKVPASLFIAAGMIDAKYIQPYMDLMGLKAMPKRSEVAFNALPALGALVGKLAASLRDGGGLDHIALAGMLTELREADGAIAQLRARASDLGMAA